MKQLLGFLLALCSIVMLNVLNYYPQAHGIVTVRQIASYSMRIIPIQYAITVLLLVGINLLFANSNSVWYVIVLMSLVGVVGKIAGGYINFSHVEATRGELAGLALVVVAAVVSKGWK
jgi:hypothetical protein